MLIVEYIEQKQKTPSHLLDGTYSNMHLLFKFEKVLMNIVCSYAIAFQIKP